MPKPILPNPAHFIGREVPGQSTYIVEELLGSGARGLVFRARSEELRNDIACKLIPTNNLVGYETGELWKSEFQKANVLTSGVSVRFTWVGAWVIPDLNVNCVVLLSEYVRGLTLETFLKQRRDDVDIAFSERFMREMLAFLYDMASKNVRHGDLHARNIIVADPTDDLLNPRAKFRVTDFGVASATTDGLLKDDYDQLALLLRAILQCVEWPSSARERFVFNVLNNEFLARHLLESDPTRDPLARRPRQMFERLDGLDTEFLRQQRQQTITLTTPFDYLSCEQLGDSHTLLKALYSQQFLGLNAIERRNNLILTGPRGCGKSTVFKSLSLRHRVLTGSSDPQDVTYVGVYYRCDDLYFAFPRFTQSTRTEAFDIPVHFTTATLLSEALECVLMWAVQHHPTVLAAREQEVADRLWETLGLSRSRVPGSETLSAIRSRLQRERMKAIDRQRYVNDVTRQIGHNLGPAVLQRACAVLTEGFEFLADRPFVFFIDDYSSPKITTQLQENLNRLLMQRSANCFFKLATESPVSLVQRDVDGKAYVEGREFEWENLGLRFLHESEEPKLGFIADVLNRRLQAIPDYPVKTVTELVGETPSESHNALALRIRNGQKQEICGLQGLGNLCSGDIHYIINVVGKMVNGVGGIEGLRVHASPRISRAAQNKAIRDEAGSFLNALKGVIAHGERLVAVVTAFGAVAHSLLRHRNARNEGSTPPHQASRIEPYDQLELSTEAQMILDDLIRYSVFLLDTRGKSRRGKVVQRLVLRRFLVPHFNLTFSLRDSVQLEARDIEVLLTDPGRFEREHLIKSFTDPGPLFESDLSNEG